MYNESRKMEFLNAIGSGSYRTAASLFRKLEPLEERLCKDICEITNDEACGEISRIIINSNRGASRVRMITLRKYVRWCMSKGYNTEDWILSMSYETEDPNSVSLVGSPMHMQKFLNEVFSQEEAELIDITYRCLYWLVYSGIKQDDVYNVSLQEVDLSKMMISHGGNEYYLYRESLNTISKCVNNTSFRYVHAGYPDDYYMDRYQSSQLIRGFKNDAKMLTTRAIISKALRGAINDGRTTTELTLSRAFMSGMFYRTLMAEYQGMEPNFLLMSRDIARDKYAGKQEKITDISIRENAKLLRTDYNNWKDFFGY